MVSFDVTDADCRLINRIAKRAAALFARLGARRVDVMDLHMDITAVHANGCPLNLAELLAADDSDLAHDVAGIQRHINRDDGTLTGCFLPRYAR